MCSGFFAFLDSVNDLGIVHRVTIKLITGVQNIQLGLQFFIGEKISSLLLQQRLSLVFFVATSKDRKWRRIAWRTSSCRRFYIPSLSSSTNVASLSSSSILSSWSITPGGVIWGSKYCFLCYILVHIALTFLIFILWYVLLKSHIFAIIFHYWNSCTLVFSLSLC